ncbi:MAG: rhomboid family [halophilic archaeon J07HX64]|jgi:Rhomboid family.|nr:MAG: rhomboid family [halophilic archaeon J07HX64]
MTLGVEDALLETVSLLAIVVAGTGAIAILVRFSDTALLDPLRERFILGVPWGTVTVVVGLVVVYYLVQGGGSSGGPVVQGFRSWSVWYPQGVLFSSFAHASESHLRGNIFGTLTFAPIVEYVWRHRPPASARVQSRYARVGVFVLGTVAVGIAGSLFVPGAIIGFSGVVFALAGFALVVRPLVTVFAILAVRAVRLLYGALIDPVVVAEARPRFISPSWADTALQGHLFGVLVGVLLAVALLRLRERRPDLRHVFFAALVFGVVRSLYAIYWFLGADEFVLFQAAGVAGIILFATLVALATLPADRRFSVGPSPATVAVALLGLGVAALAVSGFAYSLVLVSSGEAVEDGVEVRDYSVAYVDSAQDQYVGALELPGIGSPLSATTSGVVVASDRRNAWGLAVSAGELAFDGQATVTVGGPTWRETVFVDRTQWSFLDGNTTFRVEAFHDGQNRLLHTASPAVGNPRVDGVNVSIAATAEGYGLRLRRNGSTLFEGPVPARNETLSFETLSFERVEDSLLARYGDTELRLAEFKRSQRPES